MTAAHHWRPMTAADLPAVDAIAAIVHVNYPEDAAVFAERLSLHPQGCYVLQFEHERNDITGYLISHPWTFKQPPALNSLLCAIPSPASTYYIHDIALLPQARGGGAASDILAKLMTAATSFADNVSLVAVAGTERFWRRQGFVNVEDRALARKLTSYDDSACYMQRRLGADIPAIPA
ncbi:GNAT family N-acetyltransferase [Rhodopseudomonas sp. B29]|uniref:GNAT family N-acetyltransferase n=1 Tax=Rhodopseudomonas sp. B29 TaxID=95607 RepID=UPI0004CDFBBD|nr:GNAT family N-acetyltransferase [Rhodopseudomonas sp. B29]